MKYALLFLLFLFAAPALRAQTRHPASGPDYAALTAPAVPGSSEAVAAVAVIPVAAAPRLEGVVVYPATVQDAVWVVNQQAGPVRYSLLTADGSPIGTGALGRGAQQIDVSALRAGWFLVRTENQAGSSIHRVMKL